MRYSLLFIILSIFVVAIWLTTWKWVPRHYPALNDEGQPATRPIDSPGIFGDMFGGTNALFAGLSAAGIIVTLLMQARQLRDQAEDQKNLQKAQDDLTKFTSAQADALISLAEQFRTKSRREALEFLLKANEEEIARQEKTANQMYSRGTKEETRHKNAATRLNQLREQNTAIRQELERANKQDV